MNFRCMTRSQHTAEANMSSGLDIPTANTSFLNTDAIHRPTNTDSVLPTHHMTNNLLRGIVLHRVVSCYHQDMPSRFLLFCWSPLLRICPQAVGVFVPVFGKAHNDLLASLFGRVISTYAMR
ncbi:hypothetical protein ONS96_007690 [Cadophora gregata f. sp. sojae]|nr:hypothetical protein ONS96_007690 [Cadophora gregata f. sp. sojae]